MSESIDTSKLDPATLAKHLGNPEGEMGRRLPRTSTSPTPAAIRVRLQNPA